MEKDQRIYIRIDSDLKNRFDKICKDNAINKSQLIYNFIADYVKENEGK